MYWRQIFSITVLLTIASSLMANPAWSEETEQVSSDASGVEFFEKKIRPLLAEHCYECHGADEQESELRLDQYVDVLRGGKGGPSVVPGKAEASLLITAVRYTDTDLQMPPDDKLGDAQIADLVSWVNMGAPHPDAGKVAEMSLNSTDQDQLHETAAQHWAFQLPKEPVLPAVQNSVWPRSPIDVFVLHRLEAAGLAPVAAADRLMLIRRATFNLIGLPPTLEEIEAFVADPAPGAFERVIDRLLASPHYGQRWGRHWLDVARYADSNGLDENAAHANAWRYRDYVIDAMNTDKPFNVFVKEQVAGDLLASDDPQVRNQQLIATGFLSLGPKVLAEPDKVKMEMDIIDEQIDTLGKAFLGLTLGCARCHDHKFDPIATKDYYALAGIFKSTHTMDSFKTIARWHEHKLFDEVYEGEKAEHEAQVAAKQSSLDELIATATVVLQKQLGESAALPAKPEESFPEETRAELKKSRDEIAELSKAAPAAPSAMGVKEGSAGDIAVHIRGSHLTLGDIVSRGLPKAFFTADSPSIESKQSGRLALAEWIAAEDNPLTARVIVNRVWRWHFGRGLVETTNNFGLMGEAPSHPELLDWLTITFMRDGWSLKRLHRRIMLSATYQLGSEYDPQSAKVDSRNELFWRARIHRLEAEELRDAFLLVSGQLDITMGGPSIQTENYTLVFNHTSQDETEYDEHRRSVYLPVIRNHLHDSFTLFDYTDASTSNGNRNTSTVASQALFLMNSEFLAEISGQLAERVLSIDAADDAARIDWLYMTTVSRSARDEEISLAKQYLERFAQLDERENQDNQQQAAWQLICQALLISNEFVYVH